jgi:hypothetical protein
MLIIDRHAADFLCQINESPKIDHRYVIHAGVQEALKCSNCQRRSAKRECCIDLVLSVIWNGHVHVSWKGNHVSALPIRSQMHHHQGITAAVARVASIRAVGSHQHIIDRFS